MRTRKQFLILGSCLIIGGALLLMGAFFHADFGPKEEEHSMGYRMMRALDAGVEELRVMNKGGR